VKNEVGRRRSAHTLRTAARGKAARGRKDGDERRREWDASGLPTAGERRQETCGPHMSGPRQNRSQNKGGSLYLFDKVGEERYLFFQREGHLKGCTQIRFISRKTIGSTREGQLDTQRRKENKITLKSTLVVFFLAKFAVHWSLKMLWEGNKGKGHLQLPLPHKALKTAKTIYCLQRDLANAERTSAGATPQATRDCKPSSPNQQAEEMGT
jgi:hypothetical protein